MADLRASYQRFPGNLALDKAEAQSDDELGLIHRDEWGFILGAIEERFAKRGR